MAAAAAVPPLPSGRLGLALRPLQAEGWLGGSDKAAALLVQRGANKQYVALRLD